MEITFIDVLTTVFSLVLLTVPGFLLAKTGVLGEKADGALSSLVLYGCQPALVFMSFQKTEFTPSIGLNMLVVAGLAFLVHGVMIALVFICFKSKDKGGKINCLRFASVFSNCGYMGLPFLQMLFSGNPSVSGEILIYGGVVIAVFNLLTWSVGVYIMTGDAKQISVKNALLNPTVIALFIGVILFITVQKPLANVAADKSVLDNFIEKALKAVGYLAETVTPLSLIVIGVRLSRVGAKKLFLDKWAYVAAFNKLILMSMVTMLLCGFLPIDPIAKYALFFLLSMPCATNTVLFAVRFGGDADSGSVFVLLSTVLSVLTIPLTFKLFGLIFGVPVI